VSWLRLREQFITYFISNIFFLHSNMQIYNICLNVLYIQCAKLSSEYSFSDLVCNLCSYDLLFRPLSRSKITDELLTCYAY